MKQQIFTTIIILVISAIIISCSTIRALIGDEENLSTAVSLSTAYTLEETIHLASTPSDPPKFPTTEPLGTATVTPAHSTKSFDLLLFAPLQSTKTYLIDREGIQLYAWLSKYKPGNSVYLLENGNLLRTGTIQSEIFDSGGIGGIVEEIAPDSSIVWSFEYANKQVHQHHDIECLPNGNILMIAWEAISKDEVIASGRDPSFVTEKGLWSDHLIEVDPKTNQIVWEWHVWDHLVQDHDAAMKNYGVIADHPELINLNYFSGKRGSPDWNHINAVDYNPELDQILLSVRGFREIWIIDHSTSAFESASHTGGKYGRGGDLLYRWGNPQTYAAGTRVDQAFYGQHDAQWILGGFPGEGNILVFNNGIGRENDLYSTIDELKPPLMVNGNYELEQGKAYAPNKLVWQYKAEQPKSFYADHISGAQRLLNGNTLVCDGVQGIFFEVTSQKKVVWQYDFGGEVFRVTGFSREDERIENLSLQPSGELEVELGTMKNLTQQPEGTKDLGKQRLPPQKAIEACQGLDLDDICTLQTASANVYGICRMVKSQLACVPNDFP
jgi:hypothetical protein